MTQIPERDWIILKEIRPKALDRFCRRILDGVNSRMDRFTSDVDAHGLFIDVYRYLREENEQLAHLFDDWRRSTSPRKLSAWAQYGLITEKEFSKFSDETRSWITRLVEITFYRA